MAYLDYNGVRIVYLPTSRGIMIKDSYKIPYRHFHNVLSRINVLCPDHQIWEKRSYWSLECEWSVHNFLYRLGISRARTVDADLNIELGFWSKLGYHVLGTLLYIWK